MTQSFQLSTFAQGVTTNSTSGAITVNAPITLSSANVTLTGVTKLTNVFETVTLRQFGSGSIGSGATVEFDVLTQSVLYYTGNALGNFTLDVRGNSTTTLDSIMSVGQSVTITLMTGQGVGYYPSTFTIDGVAQTVKYQFGTSFTSDASTTSAFTFTIIKTFTATYYVFASQSRYS